MKSNRQMNLNLTVVIHEMYENQINPEFLHLKSEGCN